MARHGMGGTLLGWGLLGGIPATIGTGFTLGPYVATLLFGATAAAIAIGLRLDKHEDAVDKELRERDQQTEVQRKWAVQMQELVNEYDEGDIDGLDFGQRSYELWERYPG